MFSVAESGDWRQGRDVCFCTAVLVLTPCPISSSSQTVFLVYIWRPHMASGCQLTGVGLPASCPISRLPCVPGPFSVPFDWSPDKPLWSLQENSVLSQAPSCLNTLPSHLCLISIFQVDMRGREGGSHPNSLSLTQNLNQERKEPTDSTYGEVLFFFWNGPGFAYSYLRLGSPSNTLPSFLPKPENCLSPWERKCKLKVDSW